MERALGEYDISHQEKPHGKTKTPGDENGCDVRLDREEAQIDIVLVQDEIIADGIHDDIYQRIASATCCITKGLQRHDPAERRVKKVDKCYNSFFQ